MKKPGRFLFALCVALLCAFVSPAFVSADTVCKSKSQVQSELKEQLSVKGVSELVMTTDFSMKDSDIADVLDEAATANGKIYYGKVKYSITTRRGSTTSYTYKITVDPANFVKLSKYNSEKKLYVACLKALYEQDYTKRFYTGDEGCYDSMLLVLKQHPEFNYAICATKYTSLSGRIFCGFRPSDSFEDQYHDEGDGQKGRQYHKIRYKTGDEQFRENRSASRVCGTELRLCGRSG